MESTLVKNDPKPSNAVQTAVARKFGGSRSICGQDDIKVHKLRNVGFFTAAMIFVNTYGVGPNMSVMRLSEDEHGTICSFIPLYLSHPAI